MQQIKREEHAVVLDFLPQGKSGEARKEPVAQVLGETYFTLLEVVAKPGVSLSVGERVYIGREVRDKIDHIRGRILFHELTSAGQRECDAQIRKLVASREQEFVGFLNRADALNIRVHTLELLPSVGKRHLEALLQAREQKPFASFADLRERVPSFGRVEEIFVQRIVEELAGDSKYYLFTKAPARDHERRW